MHASKSALGDMNEAENLMRVALPIAERSLGENQFGTLSRKVHGARVILSLKAVRRSRRNFSIQRQRHEAVAQNEEQPHLIMAVWYLIHCYQEHGNIKDARRLDLPICEKT